MLSFDNDRASLYALLSVNYSPTITVNKDYNRYPCTSKKYFRTRWLPLFQTWTTNCISRTAQMLQKPSKLLFFLLFYVDVYLQRNQGADRAIDKNWSYEIWAHPSLSVSTAINESVSALTLTQHRTKRSKLILGIGFATPSRGIEPIDASAWS